MSQYIQPNPGNDPRQLTTFGQSRCEFVPFVELPGQEVIRTRYVDILPLSPQSTISAHYVREELPVEMGEEDRQRLREALINEQKFLSRLGVVMPDVQEHSLEKIVEIFQAAKAGKVGLRNLEIAGGAGGALTLTARYTIVPHPQYRLFNSPANDHSLRVFGANLGVAAALITSDGWLAVQHRRPYTKNAEGKASGNQVYGDVPGAAVAGLVDGAMVKQLDGALEVTSLGAAQLLGEKSEEVGSDASPTKVTLLGALLDEDALHHELAYLIQSAQSVDVHIQEVQANDFKDTPVAFKEDVLFVKATVENIEKLLCDLRSPFPKTHAPVYLLHGFLMQREQNGEQGAWSWLYRTVERMTENYRAIDQLCEGGKYTPNKNATAQGLPDVIAEFQRVFGDSFRHARSRK